MEEYNKEVINDEVLVVIAAAVAAMETRPGYRLAVRSMRQVPQNSPAWNTAGRLERLSRNLNA
jgi:hypothetical protein